MYRNQKWKMAISIVNMLTLIYQVCSNLQKRELIQSQSNVTNLEIIEKKNVKMTLSAMHDGAELVS